MTYIPGERYPIPFIVGVPRSGTTLLRAMLDAHSDLALPYETHIWSRLTQQLSPGSSYKPEEILAVLKEAPQWADFMIDEEAYIAELTSIANCTLTAAIRRFYHRYAYRLGKFRGGDKTPQNLKFMRQIQSFLPEAHFIHIVRDGRAVAASLRHLWFGPGNHIDEQAASWERIIREGKNQVLSLNNYLEIRYEDLVCNPEASLRSVCMFLELSYEPEMLRYQEQAPERMKEIGDWNTNCGLVEGNAIRGIHERLAQAPDPSRIHAWREQLTKEEVALFQERAGGLLKELGYELA